MTRVGRLPLTIVTGFLGSGKTTVLRRLLARSEMEKSLVLVNEMADIGVDQRLLQSVNGSVRLVKGGCICCTARDELRSVLLELVETRANANDVNRIILETSGLTNPAPLIETIAGHSVLNNRIRVKEVLTLIDCVNAESNLRDYSEFSCQVACADHILMTKTDIVNEQTVESVAHMIRGLNPFAKIIADEDCIVAALQGRGSSAAPVALPRHRHYTASPLLHSDIRAFCISLEEEACDWTDFAIWLSLLVHAHGRRILRIKGLLDLGGAGLPVAINCVQELVYLPEHLDDRPGMDSRSLLAFIVRDLEPARILQSLRTFLRTDRPHLLSHQAQAACRPADAPGTPERIEWESAGSRMSTDVKEQWKR